jgi:hypothetical protein
MRPLKRLLLFALILVWGIGSACMGDEPLLSLADSVQSASPENVQIDFTLPGLFTDKKGEPRDVPVTLIGINGSWTIGSPSRFAGFTLAALNIRVTREQLSGTIVISQGETQTSCAVSAQIIPAHPSDLPNVEGPSAEGLQFWTVMAQAQGVVGKVRGTCRTEQGEKPFEGLMSLVLRPGHWNMGTFENGLNLFFDMGRRRVNWNHARIAQCEFALVRDLSRHAGLRLRIFTDEPRGDVSVSVWLREADGSWYYIKDAVPLVDNENEAMLLFADFTEAEWVAPGNHMDEDYALDLKTISHLGIGVVNPLGVGPVRFTVRSLDLLEIEKTEPPPARLTVTGRMLSVNGHEVIPSGIFGGFAGHLPQQFRPGCQRDLQVVGLSMRQRHLRFKAEDILDEAALSVALRGDTPFAKHCAELLDAANPPDAKGRRRSKSLLDQLNLLLQQRDLTSEPAPNGTALWERNRRALEAAFPDFIKAAPAYGPTEQFYIECTHDRYAPPTLVTTAHWREAIHGLGASIARRSRENGYVAHFEFWNEPYLNWAERSRVALRSQYYDTDSATNGGPVRVRYKITKRDETGKPVDEELLLGPEIPHFRWVRDGDGGWKVVDPTAYSYWSGKGLGWVYDEMLGVIGPAIKTNNPAVQLVGGWDFRWNEDHWAAWDMLYKPTIDRHIQWLDGISEHHYQGDIVAMPASYEVLLAYTVTQHNKWLYCYNTECNDLVDAPARGAVDTPEKAKAASNYRKMTYNLRDCLYTVAQTPDKARARTVIHNDAGDTNGWTAVGYGLMTNLRGRLVETQSTDPHVWCVASVDGTDPLAMPPPGTPPTLVVCVFNDHRDSRSIQLDLTAPAGTELGNGKTSQAVADMTTFELRLDEQPVLATGTNHSVTIALPGRSAWKIALPLNAAPRPSPDIVRTQFFSPDILQTVSRGTNFATTVRLGARERAHAESARLRLVVESLAGGEGFVNVAGQDIPLPQTLTADNICRIVELPVALTNLADTVPVEFRVADGNHAGYRVDMTSIVLSHKPLPPPIVAQPATPLAGTKWWIIAALVVLAGGWLVFRRLAAHIR